MVPGGAGSGSRAGVSQTRAATVSLPAGSRFGLMRMKCPTGSMLPVRSFGPPRSAWMAHLRPTTCSARLRLAAIFRHAVASSWAQLMRMRSMPARSRSSMSRTSSGSGARHRHHDADQAIARCRTEQPSRVIPQQQPAAAEVDGRMRLLGGRHPGQCLETGDDRIEPGNDVRLEDAERRKPERMQVVLQAADVALAEAQVMKQVPGAVPVMRLDGINVAGVCRLELERAVAQVAEFGKRTVDEAVGGHRSAGLWRSTSLGRHGDGFIAVDGQRLPAPPPCHEIFMIDP